MFPDYQIEAFEEIDKSPICDKCGAQLTEAFAIDDDGGCACEVCAEKLFAELAAEATQFALDNCRITRHLPEYDPSLEFRCMPEEYEFGSRESYSPNAYLAVCRHGCTNYDELLRTRSRTCPIQAEFYHAIRSRIEAMIREAAPETARIELDYNDYD